TTVAGAGAYPLNAPRAVLAGSDQNLYIADTGNQRIALLTPAGDISTIAGTGAAGFGGDGGDALAAQFDNPVALAMDAAGALYIADFDNSRIRKLIPNQSSGGAVVAPAALLASATIVNSASLRAGPVASGEIVTISAAGIGPSLPVAGVYDANGMLGNLIAETQVLFDGLPAPLTYAQQGQINAQLPYGVVGFANTHVQVYHSGFLAVEAFLPVAASAPGLFTVSGSGGPALATNQDGAPNSRANPAAAGSVVSLFATGEGQTNPAGIDGKSSSD